MVEMDLVFKRKRWCSFLDNEQNVVAYMYDASFNCNVFILLLIVLLSIQGNHGQSHLKETMHD